MRYYNPSADTIEAFHVFYEQHDEELEAAEQQAVAEWFVACWKQADGQRMQLPAYFGFHDAGKSFDLRENKWVSDEEKWSE